MDALIGAVTVLEACHVEFKLQVPDSLAESKTRTLGDAAYQQILSGLANPTDDATRRKADFLLKKRTEVAMNRAQALVAEKGCGWNLVSQANGTLEKFQQAL